MKEIRRPTDDASAITLWTEARLGIGRVGASAPTHAVLEFAMDHARARDAVHAELPLDTLQNQLKDAAFTVMRARSQVHDRAEYLRRPDLGRRLDRKSREALEHSDGRSSNLLTVIVADGLSALAPTIQAVPLLEELRRGLEDKWTLDSIILATQARVALGDEIGEVRGAEAVIVLIGERPGLRSFDSLGAYLTYRPHPGRMDAERNCVSNIRAGGLAHGTAAKTLIALLTGARAMGASGVGLKDGGQDPHSLDLGLATRDSP